MKTTEGLLKCARSRLEIAESGLRAAAASRLSAIGVIGAGVALCEDHVIFEFDNAARHTQKQALVVVEKGVKKMGSCASVKMGSCVFLQKSL